MIAEPVLNVENLSGFPSTPPGGSEWRGAQVAGNLSFVYEISQFNFVRTC